LKKTVYHTAPVTTKTVPKRKVRDAIKAAFDPNDDPKGPPRQSVSEQQASAEIMPMHGLRLWTYLMTYFVRKSSNKAIRGKNKAADLMQDTWDKIPIGDSGRSSDNESN